MEIQVEFLHQNAWREKYPNTEPWGTPWSTEDLFFWLKLNLPIKYEWIKLSVVYLIHIKFILIAELQQDKNREGEKAYSLFWFFKKWLSGFRTFNSERKHWKIPNKSSWKKEEWTRCEGNEGIREEDELDEQEEKAEKTLTVHLKIAKHTKNCKS